jgi:AraC-like DNA-binding protein
LLANVSHELRTPLNIIIGYSQSALADPNPYHTELPSGLLHDLTHIYRSSEHLIRLINDLLDLSRAEIDELELFPDMITTRPFLEDVFQSIVTGLAPPSDVECRLELPEHLHIWVADTGVGIPPELQEQIFEPFVTDTRDERRPEGVGLGLTITRRLVALHRGMLTLDSQCNQGSIFHIYLPLPNLGSQSAELLPIDQSMLLVSAHRDPSAAIAELSMRVGLTIHSVQPTDDLQSVLTAVQPAALAWDLADIDSTGWSLIQQICSAPEICHLPLIIYGQDASDANRPVGITSILNKPLNRTALLEAIASLYQPTDTAPILIVDDDGDTRDLYASLVSQALPGRRVRTAASGVAALDQLAQEIPSLVILDLMMPDVDGFAVLEDMRKQERLRQVPVIILSGRQIALDDIKRLDHALVAFQSKGILSQDELSTALRRGIGDNPLLAQSTSLLVKQAIAYIQQHHARDLTRQEIAEAIGVSKNYMTQIFHQELGISLWDYLNRYRMLRAKDLLLHTDESITMIAARVGFNDPSYFGRVFRKQVGCTPQAYRDKQLP